MSTVLTLTRSESVIKLNYIVNEQYVEEILKCYNGDFPEAWPEQTDMLTDFSSLFYPSFLSVSLYIVLKRH